ncbi:hypothetical protein LSAT2_011782 [Lamellibrachia satsuma]|nr:hypothetical protein LSAT2_011782 [Lamellibrachia satsuma]
MRSNIFLLILCLMLLVSVSHGYVLEKHEELADVSDEANNDGQVDIARTKRTAGNMFDNVKTKKTWWWD